MTTIFSQKINNLRASVSQRWEEALNKANPVSDAVMPIEQVSQRQHVFYFRGGLQGLREWKGEKKVNSGQVYSLRVSLNEYEDTIGVARADIESDNLGVYGNEAARMGKSAALWHDELFAGALEDTLTLGFDGKLLFNANHPLDPGNAQSNVFTSTSLTEANIKSTIDSMTAYTDDRGKPLGVKPTHIVVPSALYTDAMSIIKATLVLDSTGAAAVSNTASMFGLQVVVLPQLTSTSTWYLLDASNPAAGAVVMAERKAPQFSELSEGSDHAFKNGEFLFSTEASGVAAPGLWFLGAKCTA